MAVSKRIRFEVFRRDEHTCQYCGAKAPDVKLHIDHVMPVALGGTDKPDNLVTACSDCNSGKTSIAPDAPLVEAVKDKAAAYALAMQDHMVRFRASLEELEDYVDEFHAEWDRWKSGKTHEPVPLPESYKMSLHTWQRQGIPASIFELAIPPAMEKRDLRGEHAQFRYMAGIISRMVRLDEVDIGVTTETAAVYTASEMDQFTFSEYQNGRRRGQADIAKRIKELDYVRQLIDGVLADGTHPHYQA